MFVNQITILQVITMYKSLIFSVFLSSLWICNLSHGFGIVVNFLKQPRHSSNIWLKLRLNDYNPKMVCGLTAFGQRFSFVVVYLFPDNCWKLTENWMKFNVFDFHKHLCQGRVYGIQHLFYITATIAVDELDCVLQYAKPGLATALFFTVIMHFQ